MDEAMQVGIDLLVISAIFVIGSILGWLVYPLTENKHDKEARLQGNLSNPRQKNALICGAFCALIGIWGIFIEMQAHDAERIQSYTTTGVIED
ncbi:MAG: hypothetical protein ITD42_01990 [Nitrosospira sp.]|nr:hypothetical protein [Nitrosospira sp.]MDW7642534.1 hypothetical protein [Nitrosomonadaceae bacterium]MBI0407359.1 hypothetical protein [Nitrosospira sp.]MBI0414320.1 hypothetical protein [Nitrosospira sp.]MBI0416188.1 hypothetical protein [Nitrosospira sp.]